MLFHPLPCSFPVAIPGTAFARGMKARAELMRRIHASLDMLEAQQAQQAQQGLNGTTQLEGPGHENGDSKGMAAPRGDALASNGEQRTALDLLYSSRDEDGQGLSR